MNKRKLLIIKWLKVAGKILLTLVLVLVVLILALRLPFVQRFITAKALAFYSEKVSTPASLGGLYLDFPTRLVVKELYLEDQEADTLIYLDRLSVSTNVLGLFSNRLELEDISLSGLTGNIHTGPDGSFNFQYIADAFTTPDTSQVKESGGMKIVVGTVTIRDSRVRYEDGNTGIDLSGKIGEIQVTADVFDLDSSRIDVDYLLVQNTTANLRLFKGASKDSEDMPSDQSEFHIGGNFAELQQVKFRLETEQMTLSSEVTGLQVEIDTLDINRQVYLAKMINLTDPFVDIEFFNTEVPDTLENREGNGEGSNGITLVAGARTVQLSNGQFRMWDHATEPVNGFDPAHMWFNQLVFQSSGLRFENGNSHAFIDNISGADARSRMKLDMLRGEFAFSDTLTYARDMELAFGETRLSGEISASYDSLSSLTRLSDNVAFGIDIRQSNIVPADIEYFESSLSEKLPGNDSRTPLHFSGKVGGTLDNIVVDGLEADWNDIFVNIQNASLGGLTDFPNSVISAGGVKVRADNSTLGRVGADSLSAYLPENMTLDSDLYYSPDSIAAQVNFISSEGDFRLDADGKLDADSVLHYRAVLDVQSLNAGRLLLRDDLGMVTLSLDVSGSGTTPQTINASVDLEADRFDFRGYSYEDLLLKGQIAEESFDGEISYSDDNLDFKFDGLVSIPGDSSIQRFTLAVTRADFEALQLTSEEFRLIGNVDADIVLLTDYDLKGTLRIDELGINRGGIRYDVSDLLLAASKSGEQRQISLESNILKGEVNATFPVTQLPDVMESYVSGYLSEDSTAMTISGKSMDFSFSVVETGFIRDILLPNLDFLEMRPVTGSLDGATSAMKIDLGIDSLKYGSLMLHSLELKVMGDSRELTADMQLESFRSGPMYMENFSAKAHSIGDAINLVIRVKDDQDSLRYNVATNIRRSVLDPENIEFRIHPDSVMMNYDEWILPDSNLVTVSPGYLWIKDFDLRRQQQQLKLNSAVTDSGDTLLILTADNFKLSEVASLAGDSIPTVSGTLNGNVDLKMNGSGFEADLEVSELAIRDFSVGDLSLHSEKTTADSYNANLTINGESNRLNLTGTYKTDRKLDARLIIDQLGMDPIETISSGSLKEVAGKVHGEFSVTGTLDAPEVNGDLIFDEVSFVVDAVNSKFELDGQEIQVVDNMFRFDNFTLADAENKTATINGEVSTEDFYQFDLDLNIKTSSFTLLDSDKDDNNLFYGKVTATSEISISGSNLLPSVDLDLTLSEDSRITYVIPESTISAQAQSDVVVFVDKDEENTQFLGRAESRDSVRQGIQGIRLDAVINVPEKAELTIVVDPITGDALTVRGNALLNLGIRPSGDITLTGRYEVKDGAYHMDFYGLVQRDFKIQEGSFILWTGNIYEAILNVTAVFTTRAKPPQTQNTERLEFDVMLLLSGQILQPEISFKIDLAEGSPAPIEVQSWVAQLNQDKTQLNKQAFGLLIFNSFFDDTGATGNWYDNLAANTARSSVSSFLSSELNKLSDKIEGVELTFDISSYEDYNQSGENVGRTQLELGLSKQFFDDRLIVKFAGNFDLEGKSAYRNNVSDFSGDIRIEYLITEDGRYRLLGFRETNYDDLLQGEIIRTGGGFIFVRDYDSLRELFKKSAKEK